MSLFQVLLLFNIRHLTSAIHNRDLLIIITVLHEGGWLWLGTLLLLIDSAAPRFKRGIPSPRLSTPPITTTVLIRSFSLLVVEIYEDNDSSVRGETIIQGRGGEGVLICHC